MTGKPGSLKALPALGIALVVGLILAWSQRSIGPSRTELAQALSKSGEDKVTASDLRSLRCDEFKAGGYSCRWEQQRDGGWIKRSGRAQIDGNGWRMAGVPPR